MLFTNLKPLALGLLAVCFLLAGATVPGHVLTAAPPEPGPKKEPGPAATEHREEQHRSPESTTSDLQAKIRTLLEQRLAITRQLADEERELHKQGLASPEAVQLAELSVLKAELDLCNTDQERVVILEKVVRTYQSIVDLRARLQKESASTETGRLQARLNLLEAEVALERARLRIATTGK